MLDRLSSSDSGYATYINGMSIPGSSGSPWVRCSSAAPLLCFIPEQGERALERVLREEQGGLKMTARMTLERWSNGISVS